MLLQTLAKCLCSPKKHLHLLTKYSYSLNIFVYVILQKNTTFFCERTQSFSWRHNTFHERTKYFYKRTQSFLWKCNKRNCFKRKQRFLEGTQHLCKSMQMFYERLHCFLREFNTFAKECNIFVLRERMFFERLPSFSGERNPSENIQN